MAINRAPFNALVDDNGTGNTGTLWGKDDIKDVLLDPIDAMISYNQWFLSSLSGGSLVGGSQALYAKYDKLVYIWAQLIFGASASSAQCRVGTLPFPVRSPVGCWHGFGIGRTWYLPINGTEINPYETTTGAPSTDANLSGANVIISAVYKTD